MTTIDVFNKVSEILMFNKWPVGVLYWWIGGHPSLPRGKLNEYTCPADYLKSATNNPEHLNMLISIAEGVIEDSM